MEITKSKVRGSDDGEIEVEFEVKGSKPGEKSEVTLIIDNGGSYLVKKIPVEWEE